MDPNYRCGVDGNYGSSSVDDWPEVASTLAKEAAALFNLKVHIEGHVPLIFIGEGKWVPVLHPFWSLDALLEEVPSLGNYQINPQKVTTTFELSRRMSDVMLRLRGAT